VPLISQPAPASLGLGASFAPSTPLQNRRARSGSSAANSINDGDYDYLVTTPELDLNAPSRAKPSPERGWVSGDPALTEVLQAGRVAVFRIDGKLSPSGCAKGPNRRTGQGQPGANEP
jgi:hypothetical protein